MEELAKIDRVLTNKLAICASPDSSRRYLRYLFRLLEVSFHGIPWLIGAFAAIYFSSTSRQSRVSVNLLMALILDLIVVLVLKVLVKRPRPSHNSSTDNMLTVNIDNKFSFPSGHTTRAIMCLFFLVHQLKISLFYKCLIVVWSVSTSLSRILLGRHYLSDVLAGCLIGYLQFVVVVKYLYIEGDTCRRVTGLFQGLLSGNNAAYSHRNL